MNELFKTQVHMHLTSASPELMVNERELTQSALTVKMNFPQVRWSKELVLRSKLQLAVHTQKMARKPVERHAT